MSGDDDRVGLDEDDPLVDDAAATTRLTARGHAHVGLQVGVMHVDNHQYVYKGGTPEEQFKIGLNNLHGSSAAKARELIAEARANGYGGARAAFYHALALVSGRSLLQLLQDGYVELQRVLSTAYSHGTSDYAEGLRFIADATSANGAQADRIQAELADLSGEVQREVRRHMGLILAHYQLDHQREAESDAARRERFADDRRRRARKYFVPRPFPPEPAVPPELRTTASSWVRLGCGAGCLVLALSLLVPVATRTSPAAAVLPVVLLATAALVFVWGASEAVPLADDRLRNLRRFEDETVPMVQWQQDEPDRQERQFRIDVERAYKRAFVNRAPAKDPDARRWRQDTKVIRRTLVEETVRTYIDAGVPESNRLDWLVGHHVKQIRSAWDDGRGFDAITRGSPVPLHRYAAMYAGLLGLAVAAVMVAAALVPVHPVTATTGCLALALAVWLAAVPLKGLYLDRRPTAAAVARAEGQRLAEEAEYERVRRDLADTPSDLEIADWLDRDCQVVLADALRTCNLKDHELRRHLILTAPAPNCIKAKAPGGPARYSRYRIVVFLLTDNGVRQITRALDFRTGEFGREERLNFRYDAMSAVRVVEADLRRPASDASSSDVTTVTGSAAKAETTPDVGSFPVRRRGRRRRQPLTAFEVILAGGDRSYVAIENFDAWGRAADSDDTSVWTDLALGASGVRSALHVLEIVAAEGADWLRQENLRYEAELGRLAVQTPGGQAADLGPSDWDLPSPGPPERPPPRRSASGAEPGDGDPINHRPVSTNGQRVSAGLRPGATRH